MWGKDHIDVEVPKFIAQVKHLLIIAFAMIYQFLYIFVMNRTNFKLTLFLVMSMIVNMYIIF